MTNPIQLLENKLIEIKEVEQICKTAQNNKDLSEVTRQKQMYIASLNLLKQLFNP